MTVVSNQEFVSNQEMYFDLALHERVFIKQGNNLFIFKSVQGYDNEDAAGLEDAKSGGNAGVIQKMLDNIQSEHLFSGIVDPVEYQRQMRDEWQ